MRLELSDSSGVLARVEERSLFMDQVKARKFEDAKLCKIHYKVLQGGSKEAGINDRLF